jgi:hypothetical protein
VIAQSKDDYIEELHRQLAQLRHALEIQREANRAYQDKLKQLRMDFGLLANSLDYTPHADIAHDIRRVLAGTWK